MTLKEKLLQKFIDANKSVKNKRLTEWSLNDLLQIILIILFIIGVVFTIKLTGWGLAIFLLVYIFLLYGYIAFAKVVRTFVLNILYPEDFEASEMQEIQLDNLFQNIDNLIRQLNE